MKGRRARGLQLIAIVVLFISLMGLLRISHITGAATYGTQQEMLAEVESAVLGFPALRFAGQGANACLVIHLDLESFYAYKIEKGAGGATITPVPQQDCGGGMDFVIKFINYEEFKSFVNRPSCGTFLAGGRGEQFWYLPSKLWPKGDYPTCNEEFAQKYCPALYYCGEPAEIAPSVFSCCSVEQLTPSEVAMSSSAAQAGIDAGVRGKKSIVLESPLGGASAFLAWILGVLVVIGLVLGALLLIHKNKENKEGKSEDETIRTIKEYVRQTKSQGFSDSEIGYELKKQGWPQDMIDAQLKKE